jgi:hypothetical protein
MASTPLLDEAMHKGSVKVCVGTPKFLTKQGFSGDMENKKDCCLLGICI